VRKQTGISVVSPYLPPYLRCNLRLSPRAIEFSLTNAFYVMAPTKKHPTKCLTGASVDGEYREETGPSRADKNRTRSSRIVELCSHSPARHGQYRPAILSLEETRLAWFSHVHHQILFRLDGW
jgi:hypothetical protein